MKSEDEQYIKDFEAKYPKIAESVNDYFDTVAKEEKANVLIVSKKAYERILTLASSVSGKKLTHDELVDFVNERKNTFIELQNGDINNIIIQPKFREMK